MANKTYKAKVIRAFRLKVGETKEGDIVELGFNDYMYLKGLGIVSEVSEDEVSEPKKESKKSKKLFE